MIIETSNGPIQTKKCICTVSMGVLNGHQLNYTWIPPWKRRAFNDMQMGHLLKVHLELHDTHGFPEDTWIYEHHEHYNYFFYHVRPAGCPWVVAYLGGDHAKEVGKKDKETLATLLQTPLVKRYQCLAKETFGETFFKDWSSQPHILGSYASHRPGEYPLNNNLNRPVDNKLFFAGEAFAGAYGQTVDGAFNSGQSTAQELVRSLIA